jgi:hypothetical protein
LSSISKKKKKTGEKAWLQTTRSKKLTPQNRPQGQKEACFTSLVISLTDRN